MGMKYFTSTVQHEKAVNKMGTLYGYKQDSMTCPNDNHRTFVIVNETMDSHYDAAPAERLYPREAKTIPSTGKEGMMLVVFGKC